MTLLGAKLCKKFEGSDITSGLNGSLGISLSLSIYFQPPPIQPTLPQSKVHLRMSLKGKESNNAF